MDDTIELTPVMVMDALAEIKAMIGKPQDTLWDADDIARYLKIETQTFRNHVVNKDGFPRPLRPTQSQRCKRWVPEHIKEWAKRCR